MALAPETIDAIAALTGRLFAAGETLDAVVRTVREANPDLSNVTGAMSSVMAEDPFREEPAFNLYLVDGSNHCWLITSDPDKATGVVIGRNDDE